MPSSAWQKRARLGVPRAHFWSPRDAETARLMEGMLQRLKDAGAVLIEADIPDVARLDAEAGFPLAFYDTRKELGEYMQGHGLSMTYRELVDQCGSPDVPGVLQSIYFFFNDAAPT